jgi:predicted amidophosphoribosyltransferase
MLIQEILKNMIYFIIPLNCSGCNMPDISICPNCSKLLEDKAVNIYEELDFELQEIPVITSLKYSGAVRKMILNFKESNRLDAKHLLAKILVQNINELLKTNCSSLVPVTTIKLLFPPSAKKSIQRRGYSHMKLLIQQVKGQLEQLLSNPIEIDYGLKINKKVSRQVGSNIVGRAKNKAGAIAYIGESNTTNNSNLYILVDDVITTGSTIKECIRALEQVGIGLSGIVCIAKT